MSTQVQQFPAVPVEPFLDANEAAAFLKKHPKTVQLWAREGKLPAYPVGDGSRKSWLFLKSELANWVRSGVQPSHHPCSNA